MNALASLVVFCDGSATDSMQCWLRSLGYDAYSAAPSLSKRVLLLIYEAAKDRRMVDIPAYRQWMAAHTELIAPLFPPPEAVMEAVFPSQAPPAYAPPPIRPLEQIEEELLADDEADLPDPRVSED